MPSQAKTQTVLITGAAHGLGRAMVERFLSAGWQVIASDIDSAPLAQLAQSERLSIVELDVTDPVSIKDALQSVPDRLDLLINNAGIIGYFPVAETDPETIIKHFQINSFGSLRLTHACLNRLAAAQGRVLNISSESFCLRTPFQIYQTTKLTLEGISDVLRRELVHLGIAVATIRPGAIRTELFDALHHIENPAPNAKLSPKFERFVRFLGKQAPSRLYSPEQVAEFIYRASTAKRLKPHYQINNMLGLKLLAALPDRLADFIIRTLL